jgi:hypothetical protein
MYMKLLVNKRAGVRCNCSSNGDVVTTLINIDPEDQLQPNVTHNIARTRTYAGALNFQPPLQAGLPEGAQMAVLLVVA